MDVLSDDVTHEFQSDACSEHCSTAIKIEPISEEEYYKLEIEQERRKLLNLTPLDLNDNEGIRKWLDSHHQENVKSLPILKDVNHQDNTIDTSHHIVKDLCNLPYEIMQRILGWLPSVKDIQNVVIASKEMEKYLSVDLLVKTAMMQGGLPKMSIERLVHPMRSASIYPPSPLRLMRMLNGKRCEVCFDDPNKARTNMPRHIRDGHGTFTCWSCCRDLTGFVYKMPHFSGLYEQETDFILNNPRTNAKHHGWRTSGVGFDDSRRAIIIATAESSGIDHESCFGGYKTRDQRNYLYRRQFIDRYGEVAGPIMTKDHFNELRTRLCCIQGDHKREQEYQTFLKVVIGGPDKQDPRYNEFLFAYDNIKERSEDMQREREIKRISSSTRWKNRKAASASFFIEKLKGRIKNNSHRPLLAYQTNLRFYVHKRPRFMPKQAPLVMHYKWVDEFMRAFLHAPVRFSSNKNIEEIVKLFEAVADDDHSEIEMDEVSTITNMSINGTYHRMFVRTPRAVGQTYRNNRRVTGRTIAFWRQMSAL